MTGMKYRVRGKKVAFRKGKKGSNNRPAFAPGCHGRFCRLLSHTGYAGKQVSV